MKCLKEIIHFIIKKWEGVYKMNLSENYKEFLRKTYVRLGKQNRIHFEEHLKRQCYVYGNQSNTPDAFLVMCAEALEYWETLLDIKLIQIKNRQRQRRRLARTIRDVRSIKNSQNKINTIISLKQIAGNYPKIKEV